MPNKFMTKKIKLSDLLFFVAYGLFLIAGLLSTSFYYKYYIGTPYKVILIFALLILIYKELIQNKLTRKTLLNFAICATLFFLVDYFGSLAVATMFILIWSARNIDFKRIAKFTFNISVLLFVFIVASAYLGIINNASTVRSDGTVRYYLGFRYALYGSAILYNITTLYLYIKKGKIKWLELLILFLANYLVYRQSDSRLSFYLVTLVLLVCALIKCFPNIFERKRVLCFGMISSFWLCAFLSLGLTYFYNSSISWLKSLNSFFGNRLQLGHNSIIQYGVTFFGQDVSWNGWGLDVNGNISSQSLENYNYVDCGYLNLLQHYGIFVFIICLTALTVALIKCYRNKNYHLLILLTFVALHAMVDDLIIYLYYNTLWFVVTAHIEDYRNTIQNVSKKKRKIRW